MAATVSTSTAARLVGANASVFAERHAYPLGIAEPAGTGRAVRWSLGQVAAMRAYRLAIEAGFRRHYASSRTVWQFIADLVDGGRRHGCVIVEHPDGFYVEQRAAAASLLADGRLRTVIGLEALLAPILAAWPAGLANERDGVDDTRAEADGGTAPRAAGSREGTACASDGADSHDVGRSVSKPDLAVRGGADPASGPSAFTSDVARSASNAGASSCPAGGGAGRGAAGAVRDTPSSRGLASGGVSPSPGPAAPPV